MSEKILVVAAHPDDEVLGCGGYIARKFSEGCEVKVLFLTNGVSARSSSSDSDISHRLKSVNESCKILGVKEYFQLDFPDNAIDSVPLLEIIKGIEGVISDFNPDVVLTHHAGDLNIDHQLAHKATITACRPLPASNLKRILCFETLSASEWSGYGSKEFSPNFFVDISEFLEKKIEAVNAYSQEMRDFPHPRSLDVIRSLAILRGSNVGRNSAESFILFREVN